MADLGADIAGGVGGLASLATSAFNIHESRQNRRFQRDMSNTAHQREVADLRKAGLNPILSAKLGGSSTPSGSTPEMADSSAAATSAYQAVKSGSQVSKQNELIEAQTAKTWADADASTTTAENARWTMEDDRKLRYAQAAMAMNDTFKSDVSVDKAHLQAFSRKLLDEADQAHSAAQLYRLKIPESAAMAKFYRGVGGKIAPWLNSAKTASQTVAPFVP